MSQLRIKRLVNKMLQLVHKDHEWLTARIMPIAAEIVCTHFSHLFNFSRAFLFSNVLKTHDSSIRSDLHIDLHFVVWVPKEAFADGVIAALMHLLITRGKSAIIGTYTLASVSFPFPSLTC